MERLICYKLINKTDFYFNVKVRKHLDNIIESVKKSENYNPKVGDKVEEIEKELNWLVDKNVTDPITGEESIEKVTDEEEIKEIIKNNKENNSDTELKTEWVEK